MRSPMMMPSQVPSSTNVTCTVARYSAIFPFSTAAFSLSTSMPVMPRSVRLARSSALRTASSQLWGDAPITCVMRATAMVLPFRPDPSLEQKHDLHVHPVLDDLSAVDLDPLADDLESRDVAERARGTGETSLDRLPTSIGGGGDDLRHPCDCHNRRVARAPGPRK